MEVDESVVEAYLASSTEDTENAEKGGDGSGGPGGSDGSGAPGGSDTAGAPGDSTGVWRWLGPGVARAPGIARRRLEMARGRLAGCRRELPEQMIARRCRTG